MYLLCGLFDWIHFSTDKIKNPLKKSLTFWRINDNIKTDRKFFSVNKNLTGGKNEVSISARTGPYYGARLRCCICFCCRAH